MGTSLNLTHRRARGDAWPSVGDRVLGGVFAGLPTRLVSALARRLAEARAPWLRGPLNRWFARRFGLELEEAEHPDPDAYPSFNALFTRALKPGTRPLPPDPEDIACPCDGRISALGRLSGDRILQAKGHDFSVAELLADTVEEPAAFRDAAFATIYLAPHDYHRVHAPVGGWLRAEGHIPGRLLTVAPWAVRSVPRLFCRNERLVTVWATPYGPVAVILVGAINVGGLESVWAGPLLPAGGGAPATRRYSEADTPARLARGDELGRFNFGSTVIVLLPGEQVAWHASLAPGRAVRVGASLGKLPG